MEKNINVYSEIGELKEVLVHTPGEEIERISPNRLDELLFSAILEPKASIEEHKSFIEILKKEGVKVIQLVDLVANTYKQATQKEKDEFIDKWLDEAEPKLSSHNRRLVKQHLLNIKDIKKMLRKMMSGFYTKEIEGIKSNKELVIDPMPNLYFTRDPFASIGNGVSINRMKYPTRRRETIFANFIFSVNKKYKNVPKYFNRNDKYTIEGGDIFIYNKQTLVIGVSERTNIEAIKLIAKNIKNNKECSFKKIIAINVPPMPNLMHLDTWLTMLDYDKFLYSPNMLDVLKVWEIDLTKNKIEAIERNESLESILEKIINKKPILIPIAGKNATQLDIDIETHFDGTNFVVIRPGVVTGYSRNEKTIRALKDAGIKVLSFNGDQLSLGMGSARCMSMPLIREDI